MVDDDEAAVRGGRDSLEAQRQRGRDRPVAKPAGALPSGAGDGEYARRCHIDAGDRRRRRLRCGARCSDHRATRDDR
jgi:hypothetical protein